MTACANDSQSAAAMPAAPQTAPAVRSPAPAIPPGVRDSPAASPAGSELSAEPADADSGVERSSSRSRLFSDSAKPSADDGGEAKRQFAGGKRADVLDTEFFSAVSVSDAPNVSSEPSSPELSSSGSDPALSDSSAEDSDASRSGSETYVTDFGGPVVRSLSGWGKRVKSKDIVRTYSSDSFGTAASGEDRTDAADAVAKATDASKSNAVLADDWADSADAALDGLDSSADEGDEPSSRRIAPSKGSVDWGAIADAKAVLDSSGDEGEPFSSRLGPSKGSDDWAKLAAADTALDELENLGDEGDDNEPASHPLVSAKSIDVSAALAAAKAVLDESADERDAPSSVPVASAKAADDDWGELADAELDAAGSSTDSGGDAEPASGRLVTLSPESVPDLDQASKRQPFRRSPALPPSAPVLSPSESEDWGDFAVDASSTSGNTPSVTLVATPDWAVGEKPSPVPLALPGAHPTEKRNSRPISGKRFSTGYEAKAADDAEAAEVRSALAEASRIEEELAGLALSAPNSRPTSARVQTRRPRVRQDAELVRRRRLAQRIVTVRAGLEIAQMACAGMSASAQTEAARKTGDEAKFKLRAERASLAATVDFLAKQALEAAMALTAEVEAKVKTPAGN